MIHQQDKKDVISQACVIHHSGQFAEPPRACRQPELFHVYSLNCFVANFAMHDSRNISRIDIHHFHAPSFIHHHALSKCPRKVDSFADCIL
mmetsp:Transcript_24468/g.51936  ORF Transcript_24468/g.51936 Transcript_24468/m.51936 type:complete len:91 (-) Transcript_24468:753-1025(-)